MLDGLLFVNVSALVLSETGSFVISNGTIGPIPFAQEIDCALTKKQIIELKKFVIGKTNNWKKVDDIEKFEYIKIFYDIKNILLYINYII